MKSRNEKKKLGQFFSHSYLVKFILSQIKPKSEAPCMLDPSCGEGIFLKEFLIQYPKSNVIGIDIDQTAIDEAIKQLKTTIHEKSKDKTKNYSIFHFNALLPKFELERLFKTNQIPLQFDFILGNPPYYVIKDDKDQSNPEIELSQFSPINTSNLNIASLFLFRYVQYLKPGGQLFFIFPRSLLHVESFRNLRKYLLEYQITHIFDIGKAFPDVGLEQIIIGITKNNQQESKSKIKSINSTSESNNHNQIHYGLLKWNPKRMVIEETITYTIPQSFWNITPKYFLFISDVNFSQTTGSAIYQKIQQFGKKSLSDFCVSSKILGIDPIFRGFGLQKYSIVSKKSPDDIKILGGRNIYTFGQKKTCRYLPLSIISPQLNQKRNVAMINYPKILVQNLASSKIRLVATYDENYYNNSPTDLIHYTPTFDTITNIIPIPAYARFILALLTSEFCTYYCRDFIFLRQTLTLHVDKKYLEQIPFPNPTPDQLNTIDQMVKDLERLIQKLNEKNPVPDRMRPFWENPTSPDYPEYREKKSKIDHFIYEMFDLTYLEKEFISFQLKEFDENF